MKIETSKHARIRAWERLMESNTKPEKMELEFMDLLIKDSIIINKHILSVPRGNLLLDGYKNHIAVYEHHKTDKDTIVILTITPIIRG